MSARDVMAEAIWLYEREIAGSPLPPPSWATYKANDPETAMIYETHAGSVDAALRAAGYAVVPVQPTKEMILAGDTAQDDCTDMDRDSYGTSWRVRSDAYLDIYRAMIAAAGEPT